MWNFRKKCGTLGKYVEFFTVFGFPSLILYWLHNSIFVFFEESSPMKIKKMPPFYGRNRTFQRNFQKKKMLPAAENIWVTQ